MAMGNCRGSGGVQACLDCQGPGSGACRPLGVFNVGRGLTRSCSPDHARSRGMKCHWVCLDALGIDAEGCVSRGCFLVRTGAASCCARLIVSCRTTWLDVRISPQVRRRAGQSWFASASGACMESRLLPRRRRSRLLDRWVRMAARAASASWLLMAL